MFEVIENFFPKSYQDEIEETMSRFDFPWYYQPMITTGKPKVNDERFKYSHGFTHQFFHAERGVESKFWGLIQNLQHYVPYDTKGYYRLKANLTVPVKGWTKDTVQEPHIDMPIPHLVCLYYVNDSDGDTFFFDQMFDEKAEPTKFTVYRRVAPKKGTAVIFDGLRYHGSNNPIESNNRYIINAGLII
jgi:hypothetical protein